MPEFQRRKVWSPAQKCRLIESLLLRIPLPAFYFSTAADGKMQVVDGLQRLSTIHDFVRGGPKGEDNSFRLKNLEYLSDLEGKNFKAIENTSWARRILSTQLSVNVVDPQTPEQVKLDIFKRINTGGSFLNAQEIRYCMTGKKVRGFLNKLSKTEEFNRATHNQLKNHTRMADLEVILRYLGAIHQNEIHPYPGNMNEHLSETSKWAESLSEGALAQLETRFVSSMNKATALFGDYAFRKWPSNNDRKLPINRALFEVWTLELEKHALNELNINKSLIVEKFRTMMKDDYEFIEAITIGTGDRAKFKLRFEKVAQLMRASIP